MLAYIVVLAAMPTARETAAMIETIGMRMSIRNPYRTSCKKSDIPIPLF
jgi:hypothetical protein